METNVAAPLSIPRSCLALFGRRICFLAIWAALPLQAQTFQSAYDLAKPPGAADAPDLLAYGSAAGDGFGRVIRTGDLNGDGIDDLIIGTSSADIGTPTRVEAGAVYVWFGQGALAGTMDAAGTVGSAPDLTISGASATDQLTLGGAIAVGDVNGDGLSDLVLGAGGADGSNDSRSDAGEAYVIFGRTTFPARLDLDIQGVGGADVTLYGATVNDQLTTGGAIAVGDVNGDGIADLILGAVFADGPNDDRMDAGEVCIVLGRVSFPTELDLAISGNGGADVTIHGATTVDTLTAGGALATGDVNGDGMADLLLGAVGGDGPIVGDVEGRNFAGEAYVVFGRDIFPATIDLSIQGESGAGVTLYGASAGDQLTSGGATAVQDVNGDGIADILLGAIGGDGPANARNGAGEAYIIFGRQNPTLFPATLDLSVQGSNGADVTVFGANAGDNLTSGGALAVGDVDGNGIADILLGSPLADGPGEQRSAAGEAYIVLGRVLLPAVVDLNTDTATAHADVTVYGVGSGDNLSIGGALMAGDVNGDGIADVLLGARDADGPGEARSAAGEAYIIFGRASFPATLDMTEQGNGGANVIFYGATTGDQLTSGGTLAFGDLNGDGFADLILGAGLGDGPVEGRNGAGETYVLFGVGATVAGPEIAVEQPVGATLSDSGSRSFGAVLLGSSSNSKTFTIKNIGTEPLTGLILTKDGANKDDFTVDSASISSTLAAGTSMTFSVTFTPSSLGIHNAAVHVASNDPNENPYDINLSGTGTTPEIAMEQPVGTDMASGANRSFGPVPLGGSQNSLTFTIKNNGSADLTNFVFTKTGAHKDDYTISAPGSASVAAGSSTTFTITFTPSGLGNRDAVIHLASNDADENPFDITLTGSGVEPTPEITVQRPVGTNILTGANQSFGSLALGANVSVTFTIKNTGTADLAGLNIVKEGLHAADYSVTAPAITTVAPGMNTTFVVTFTPSALGPRNVSLHIASNDEDENPFDINITGTGTDPEIAVEQPAQANIADGGGRDFGTVLVGDSSSLTFIVQNTGTTDLTDLSITKDGAHPGDFVISALGSATVAPNNSISFTVTFTPGAVGIRGATLHLANNDANENPFDISLTGNAIAPEIAVELPVGTDLQDGISEVNFDGVVIESSSPAKTFTIRNTGTAALTGLAVTKTGAAAADFVLGSLGATSLNPGASTTFTVAFSPAIIGTKTAALHIASNDADEGSFDISLSATAFRKEPVLVTNPLSRIAFLASRVVFEPIITGSDPKTYQWSKGIVMINTAAGRASTYTIASAKAGDAGIYSQRVTNAFGNAVSSQIYLGVIKRAPLTASINANATLTLACTVTLPAGITPIYTWQRDNQDIQPNSRISGLGDKTLKITGILPEEAGVYTCRVTMATAAGPVYGTHGDTVVTVVEKPEVTGFSLETAYVGEVIDVAIPSIKHPTSFSATGLPPGIVIGKTTGVLSGKPTAAKLKNGLTIPYEVKVTVRNSAGASTSLPVNWWILALPQKAVGTFDGLVARQSPLNNGLGGRIRLVTTTTGSFSGNLVLGALKYPLKGVLTTPPGGGNPTGLVNITRKSPLPNLVIAWTINITTGKLEGSINDTAPVTAWRTAWHSGNKAAGYEGNYTAALLPSEMESALTDGPQGDGFVTLSIAPTGIAKWAGKLADGTAVTGSVTLGPDGQVALNVILYTNLGSVQGWSAISLANGHLDSTGDWDWFKDAQPTSRSYAGGIPLRLLTLIGGKYSKPAPTITVLDLPPSTGNASIAFSASEAAEDFAQVFTITPANAVQMPANTNLVKLSLAAATGLFTGGFTLSSPDVFNVAKPDAILKRPGTFSGVLVQRLGCGTGHFLLPGLPQAAGQTIKKTPVFSGHVSLEATVVSP